jgi:hypothetical protein
MLFCQRNKRRQPETEEEEEDDDDSETGKFMAGITIENKRTVRLYRFLRNLIAGLADGLHADQFILIITDATNDQRGYIHVHRLRLCWFCKWS